MKIMSLLCMFVVISAVGFSATIYVPDDYPTIQEAIDSAKDGSTIIVREGMYHNQFDFLGKAITVKSEKGPNFTTLLVASGAPHIDMVSGEGPDSVLDGFWLLQYPYSTAINIDKGSPTIRNCVFDSHGGPNITGIESVESSSMVVHCNFVGVDAMRNYAGNPVVKDSMFRNSGGIENFNGSSVTVVNSNFHTNRQSLSVYQSTAEVINCTFTFNGDEDYYFEGTFLYAVDSVVDVANSIVYDNWGLPLYEQNSTVTITYSDVDGGYPGVGNIDADPLFVFAGDYPIDIHLRFTSPCRDAGNNALVDISTDFEGDPRIVDGTVDMGADEFHPHLAWVTRKVQPALFPGNAAPIVMIGYPNTSPVLLAIGSGVLEDPIPTRWGDWWLQFPILGPFDFGSIPADGVIVFEPTVPPDVPEPSSFPMQALIGTELTNLSELMVGFVGF